MTALAEQNTVGKSHREAAAIWRAREAWWREHGHPSIAPKAIADCRENIQWYEARAGKEANGG